MIRIDNARYAVIWIGGKKWMIKWIKLPQILYFPWNFQSLPRRLFQCTRGRAAGVSLRLCCSALGEDRGGWWGCPADRSSSPTSYLHHFHKGEKKIMLFYRINMQFSSKAMNHFQVYLIPFRYDIISSTTENNSI